ncbi:hypothetical protein ACQJBY_015639 [Aegilops geniculata]
MAEERLATTSATSKAMAMMQRLQKQKAKVQMKLRQFCRFAAEIDHLRALIACRTCAPRASATCSTPTGFSSYRRCSTHRQRVLLAATGLG